jgi:hypothetical protein
MNRQLRTRLDMTGGRRGMTLKEYDEIAKMGRCEDGKMRRCEGGLLLPQSRHELFFFTFYIFNFTFGQRQPLEK